MDQVRQRFVVVARLLDRSSIGENDVGSVVVVLARVLYEHVRRLDVAMEALAGLSRQTVPLLREAVVQLLQFRLRFHDGLHQRCKLELSILPHVEVLQRVAVVCLYLDQRSL